MLEFPELVVEYIEYNFIHYKFISEYSRTQNMSPSDMTSKEVKR